MSKMSKKEFIKRGPVLPITSYDEMIKAEREGRKLKNIYSPKDLPPIDKKKK